MSSADAIAIIVRALRTDAAPRAHLDSPRATDSTRLPEPGIEMCGWVDPAFGGARIVLRNGMQTTEHPLNDSRPDVVRVVRPELVGSPDRLLCGFRFHVPWQSGLIEIGVEANGQLHWLWAVEPSRQRKVIEGGDGWLFLDNDTNLSVDQYTGKRLMEPRHLEAWSNYFREVAAVAKARNLPWLFLLAPAKEYLFGDRYPHARGEVTPVDQFLQGFGAEHPIVWPVPALVGEREACFWRGDTHWTDLGAALAAEDILTRFGLPTCTALDDVVFRHASHAGDLGGKLVPKRMNRLFEVVPDIVTMNLVFDNGVHNHGRIRRYRRPGAPIDARCVVLGDSYSVNLAPWLGSAFSEVVLAHTAAAWDRKVLERLAPDYLVLQSNSRFIVTPPSPSFSFDELVASKLGVAVTDGFDALNLQRGSLVGAAP